MTHVKPGPQTDPNWMGRVVSVERQAEDEIQRAYWSVGWVG